MQYIQTPIKFVVGLCALLALGLVLSVGQAGSASVAARQVPPDQAGKALDQARPQTHNSGSALGNAAPAPPANPNLVLYDQINNPAPVPGGVTSQDFETA